MATAPALMTIEQYLRTSYRPDVHFLEGELEERNVGEFDHGVLQGLIFSWFLQRKARLRVVPVVELRVQVSTKRVRICDVAAVAAGKPRQQVAVDPPLFCIEVLSPDDRLARAQNVLADYHAMGVENIWLIDPLRRAAHYFDEEGLHVAQDGVLRTAGTEIVLDLAELFNELDEWEL